VETFISARSRASNAEEVRLQVYAISLDAGYFVATDETENMASLLLVLISIDGLVITLRILGPLSRCL
jgi:hypothetical protein